ncbi:MAG: tetratricopeptide repeat protein [Rhodothermales bacterium]
MSELDHFHFTSTNDRLQIRWSRLLRNLCEKSDDFWLDLAVKALMKRHYSDALVNLYQALEVNPDNARALLIKGQVLQLKAFDTDDVEQHCMYIKAMVECYENALLADPSLRPDVERRLRSLYFNEFKRGVEAFNRGREDESLYDIAAVFFENAARIRRPLYKELVGPETPWSAEVNHALALIHAHRPDEAIAPLQRAIVRGDRSVETFVLLAGLHEDQAQSEEEIDILERAHILYPDNGDIRARLLNAYLRGDKVREATALYEEALSQDADNLLYRYNYGSLLLDVEAFDEAIVQLQQVVKIDAYHTGAQYNLGVAFFNKALSLNALIHEVEDTLSEAQNAMPADRKQLMQDRQALDEQRRALFGKAVNVLEKAHMLTQKLGEDTSTIHRALLLAYSQLGRQDKIEALLAPGHDEPDLPIAV